MPAACACAYKEGGNQDLPTRKIRDRNVGAVPPCPPEKARYKVEEHLPSPLRGGAGGGVIFRFKMASKTRESRPGPKRSAKHVLEQRHFR